MMRGGAVDRVVFAGPAHLGQELGDDIAVLGLLDVLTIGPPAKVIRPLEILVRTLEQRNVAIEKRQGIPVWDVGVPFLVIRIKLRHVLFELHFS